jgi:hypothetical protein
MKAEEDPFRNRLYHPEELGAIRRVTVSEASQVRVPKVCYSRPGNGSVASAFDSMSSRKHEVRSPAHIAAEVIWLRRVTTSTFESCATARLPSAAA